MFHHGCLSRDFYIYFSYLLSALFIVLAAGLLFSFLFSFLSLPFLCFHLISFPFLFFSFTQL